MNDVSLSGAHGLKGRERQKISTLLWRAVRQIANGGVSNMVVWRNDALFRPWPEGYASNAGAPVPHNNGAFFSNGAGYQPIVIDVRTYDDAPLRATAMSFELFACGELQGGESFSIHHVIMGWRIYEIATVVQNEDYAVVTFNPPLREAVSAGTRVEFDNPRCVMRLVAPSSMDLSVAPWTFNSASASFVESFA